MYLCSKNWNGLKQETFNYPQARAFAGQYGLIVGLMWIASFGCAMYAFDYNLLGHAGNLLALLSLFIEVKLIRQFQYEIATLSTLRRWWMAWNVAMYAALLTSFVQFIYFKFLDNGHLIGSFNRMMEKAEFREAMESLMPGQNIEDLMQELANQPVGTFLVNFIAFNFFVALVFSVICCLFATVRVNQDKTK